MARLMLIANPAASQFTGGDHRSIVGSLSRRHLVEAVWPNSAAEARTIASDAITAGFDGVVAMGGDGIVHQVAQALVDTEVFLGVIPAGTTNVFARQIGLPARPARAARHLAGEPRLTHRPVVTVSTPLADGMAHHHAVFAVGVGMDADIVAAAETEPYRKYRFGAVHYARTALNLLWSDLRKRPPTIAVASGEDQTKAIGAIVQFHPTFTYFGRKAIRFGPVPPEPMNLLVVERLPARRLPGLLRRLATGSSLDEAKDLQLWSAVESFSFAAEPPARVEIDGEIVGTLHQAEVTFRPQALWVAGPSPG